MMFRKHRGERGYHARRNCRIDFKVRWWPWAIIAPTLGSATFRSSGLRVFGIPSQPLPVIAYVAVTLKVISLPATRRQPGADRSLPIYISERNFKPSDRIPASIPQATPRGRWDPSLHRWQIRWLRLDSKDQNPVGASRMLL